MNIPKFLPICALVGATFLAISSKASAVPLTYEISSITAPAAPDGSGLTIQAGSTPTPFTLDDSDVVAFTFFTIDVGNAANSYSSNFTASINFNEPTLPGGGVSFTGSLSDSNPSLLSLDQPLQIVSASDRTFQVLLLTVIGVEVPGGISFISVTANINQVSSMAPSVPDASSTAMLLGLGFLALALGHRKFRSRHYQPSTQ